VINPHTIDYEELLQYVSDHTAQPFSTSKFVGITLNYFGLPFSDGINLDAAHSIFHMLINMGLVEKTKEVTVYSWECKIFRFS
jgi:hypothetical protein